MTLTHNVLIACLILAQHTVADPEASRFLGKAFIPMLSPLRTAAAKPELQPPGKVSATPSGAAAYMIMTRPDMRESVARSKATLADMERDMLRLKEEHLAMEKVQRAREIADLILKVAYALFLVISIFAIIAALGTLVDSLTAMPMSRPDGNEMTMANPGGTVPGGRSGVPRMKAPVEAQPNTVKRTVGDCRVRESGMPAMEHWESLILADDTLDRLGFRDSTHTTAVELGCGYGTFTIPTSRRVDKLFTFDIDPQMVKVTQERASTLGLGNIHSSVRDVLADGYGVPQGTIDAVLLNNILHCEEPVQMLQEAALLLVPGSGRLYATHWSYDAATPRGPPMDIRPRPAQLERWALETGLLRTLSGPVECPPWHYGWTFERV